MKKGIYILVIQLPKNSEIQVGRLGHFIFPKGWYAYVGSAMNGLDQRLARHWRKDKKLHWHIDYLLIKSELKKQICRVTDDKADECLTASRIAKIADKVLVKGFGSSDCECESHLFYFKKSPIQIFGSIMT